MYFCTDLLSQYIVCDNNSVQKCIMVPAGVFNKIEVIIFVSLLTAWGSFVLTEVCENDDHCQDGKTCLRNATCGNCLTKSDCAEHLVCLSSIKEKIVGN